MDTQTLMMAGVIVLVLVAVWLMFSGDGNEETRSRMKAVSGVETGSTLGFLKEDDSTQRRKTIEESLQKLESDTRDRAKERKSLASRLVQANWSITPQSFLLVSAAIGVVVGLLVFLFIGQPIIAAGAVLAFGYVIPQYVVLKFAIARRQVLYLRYFADAMDIIVRGVRSGLPLNDCLKIIAHESNEPVASEFKLVVQGEQVGVPIDVCLERMYDRVPLPEVNFFSTVLAIQKQSGGNLGEALANLSNVLRGRKLLREKIKALSAEAKTSAVIIGALPIFVMILVSILQPNYLSELFTTQTGNIALGVGAIMMVFGTLVMRKMINFKI